MSSDTVASHYEQFRAAVVLKRNGSAVSLVRFHMCLRWPDVLPKSFSRFGINGDKVGIDWAIRTAAAVHRLITVEHLYENFSIVNGWAGTVGPLISELAVIFLKIARPKRFSC